MLGLQIAKSDNSEATGGLKQFMRNTLNFSLYFVRERVTHRPLDIVWCQEKLMFTTRD